MKNLLKFDPKTQEKDIDLFPLYDGLKPSSMGLKKLDKKFSFGDKRTYTFLINEDSFPLFRESKENCRNERLSKYYQKKEDFSEINMHIINTLCDEYPQYFSLKNNTLICFLTKEEISFNDKYELTTYKSNLKVPFKDLFDALAMQVPEDMVIHKVPSGQLNPLKNKEDKRDYASVIHLCHCNGWESEWAINQSFDFIHEGVHRISSIIPNSLRMMLSFLKGFRFERIAAISFKSTSILNRHAEDMNHWSVPFNDNDPFMNIRVERQTITGFEKSEAFLFTIKTYLYDMDFSKTNISQELRKKRINAIENVFTNPDEKSYAYDIITKNKSFVLNWMKKQKDELKI